MEMRSVTPRPGTYEFGASEVVPCMLLVTLMVLTFFVNPILAVPSVQLSLRRDWGYGGFGGDINGRFTAIAQVSADVVRVEFFLDRTLVLNLTSPPFEWRFDTNDYPLGEHTIGVKAFDIFGGEARAEVSRIFVEPLAFPIGLVPIAVVFGVAIFLVLYRLGVFRGTSSLGVTRCPRCSEIFPRKWSPVHMFGLLLNTCPKCGRRFWASRMRDTVEEPPLRENGISKDGGLREEIERSRYEEPTDS